MGGSLTGELGIAAPDSKKAVVPAPRGAPEAGAPSLLTSQRSLADEAASRRSLASGGESSRSLPAGTAAAEGLISGEQVPSCVNEGLFFCIRSISFVRWRR